MDLNNQGILKVCIHLIDEGDKKRKYLNLNRKDFTYGEIQKRCKEEYEGLCEINLVFKKNNKPINNQQNFNSIFLKYKQKDLLKENIIFQAHVVGGSQKINSIRHLLKRNSKSQQVEEPPPSHIQPIKPQQNGIKIKKYKQPIISQQSQEVKIQTPQTRQVGKKQQKLAPVKIQERPSQISGKNFQQSKLMSESLMQKHTNIVPQPSATKALKPSQASQKGYSKEELNIILAYFIKEMQVNLGKKCHQCKKDNFRGPVYQCLICQKQKIYLCTYCQMKPQRKHHNFPSHTFAKVKYNSQMIMQKKVKVIGIEDIPPPQLQPKKAFKPPHRREPQHPSIIPTIKSSHPLSPEIKPISDKHIQHIEIVKQEAQVLKQQKSLNKEFKTTPEKKQNQAKKEFKTTPEKIQNQVNKEIKKQSQPFNQSTVSQAHQTQQSPSQRVQQQQPIVFFQGHLLQPLTKKQQEMKLNKIKRLYNCTDDQVKRYMEGKFKYMNYKDVLKYIQE